MKVYLFFLLLACRLSCAGSIINSFAAPGEAQQWEFYAGSEFPGGKGSFKVKQDPITSEGYAELAYDFRPPAILPALFDPHYVLATRRLSSTESLTARRVRFQARKSRPDLVPFLRITDASGQTLQFQSSVTAPLESRTGWARHGFDDISKSSVYWGGARDGITKFPLQSIAIVCAAEGLRDAGFLAIDNVELQDDPWTAFADFRNANEAKSWTLYKGGEFPGARGGLSQTILADGAYLQLSYDFSMPAGWVGAFDPHYIEMDKAVPSTTTQLRFSLQISNPGISAQIRFVDSSGQTFQADITRSDDGILPSANTWFDRVVCLTPSGARWGGAKDGVVHFPIKTIGIVLDAVGRRDQGFIRIRSAAGCALPISEVSLSSQLQFPSESAGPLADRAGVNMAFTDDARALDAASAAGFTWVRKDASWNQVEKPAGIYNFSSLDAFVSGAELRGISVVVVIDYGNDLYTGGAMSPPRSAISRAAYGRFCSAIAQRYITKKVAFEIWNEPDVGAFWSNAPNATEYGLMLAVATQAIKSVNPAARIITGGLSSVWIKTYNFWDILLANANMTGANAWGTHLYPGIPESSWEKIINLQELARRTLGARLWCTEWGYSSQKLSLSGVGTDVVARRLQASMNVRQLLVGWWANLPLVMVYDIRDKSSDARDSESNFGLLANDYSEKPAMLAMRRFLGMAKGRVLAGAVAGSPNNSHVFRLDGAIDRIYVAWIQESGDPVSLVIPDQRSTATDQFGNAIALIKTGNRLTYLLKTNKGPVFIKVPD